MWLLFLCFILVLYWLWSDKRNSNEPPYVPGAWPILGHKPFISGDASYLWKFFSNTAEQTHRLGGVSSISIGPRRAYVITDPDDSLTVANSCLQKNWIYEFVKSWTGEGLVTATEPVWKVHRKLIRPAFNQAVLDSYIGVFNRQSRKLVTDLEVEVGKGQFHHSYYLKHNSLEAIIMTTMGLDLTEENLYSEYLDALDTYFSIAVKRLQRVWLQPPLIFGISGDKKKQDRSLKILHKISKTVIQRRKSELNNERSKVISGTKGKWKPFLDLLLELSEDGGKLMDKEIREEVDTMIAAGYDTLSTTMTFILMLVGSHSKVQASVSKELQELFEGSERDVEKADLSKLVYLEAVIKESIRMYTTVPVVGRTINKDVKLKNYTLSSGCICLILLHGIHRHRVWGHDADQFKPERWFDPAKLPDNPNAFASFSIGRRACIGQTFAMMSMKIQLAHLLRRYRVTADHTKMELKFDVMLTPKSGHTISIERREIQ